jgi:hypothetical protein
LRADAVAAHAALLVGDTVTALGRLQALAPDAPPDSIPWLLWEPLGFERIALVRLLLATDRPRDAIAVASVFDSPEPLVYLLFLPASLELRADAARELGDLRSERRYRDRLAALRSHTEPFSHQ